jgi:hypothetical protein
MKLWVKPSADKDWMDASLKVMEHMAKQVRRGITKGVMPCPMCKTGAVRWASYGPRSSNFACDTPDCISGLS